MYVFVVRLQLILCFIYNVSTDRQHDNLCQICFDWRRIPYTGYVDGWACCPGFSRQNTEDECKEIDQGCEENYYRTGDQCSPCDCNWENAYLGCAKESGACFCKPGYHGAQCNSECRDGYFGQDCKYECSCKNNSTCNKTDGQCPCSMPGWTGMRCTEACSANRYGMFCAETCDCSPSQNRFCDSEEGCICNQGYTGETCNEVCPPADWTYGPACRESCLCQQLGTERCDPESGACSCKPGWEGDFCTELCSNSTYGKSCNETCQCELFEICLPTNGSCVCPLGSSGERCEMNSNDTTVILRDGGHNFPLVAMVSVIFLTLILVAVTTGIFILARRFRSRKQLKRNESIPPTPENEHYSNIANGICVAPVNDHYNSLHEPLPEQTSTNHNMKPYDQMKMISAREGMYDSFHVSQVDMVIGEEYDSVRMSDPKASSQYDHTTTNADRVNRKIANVAGSNYDNFVPVNTKNSDS
ncbi:platelet endothelial aggregation receptor 1-like isoform X2 [Mizuhopecten yessoensis]|uniref:platelet endothelial aggregation receptor 1-like isoform X2 n=1 Tax=Mizuhopecten yessoensis TaxID=6573 RepID=UPI000B45A1A6|nr:platelet endothelial aggregation receptor 1-like isoform X2 [Mizuhopecten yessoensis]